MRATALLLLALAAASAAAPVLQESFATTDAWASATDERYSGKVKAVKLGEGGAIQVRGFRGSVAGKEAAWGRASARRGGERESGGSRSARAPRFPGATFGHVAPCPRLRPSSPRVGTTVLRRPRGRERGESGGAEQGSGVRESKTH